MTRRIAYHGCLPHGSSRLYPKDTRGPGFAFKQTVRSPAPNPCAHENTHTVARGGATRTDSQCLSHPGTNTVVGRGGLRFGKDTRPGMLSNCFNSAICVQNFNDSLSCAIRITYRSSQRSSSIYEPRDPPLKVVGFLLSYLGACYTLAVMKNVCQLLCWFLSG